jgi:hypothetical protein
MDQHEDGKPSSDTSPPANDASGPHATDSASDPIESLASIEAPALVPDEIVAPPRAQMPQPERPAAADVSASGPRGMVIAAQRVREEWHGFDPKASPRTSAPRGARRSRLSAASIVLAVLIGAGGGALAMFGVDQLVPVAQTAAPTAPAAPAAPDLQATIAQMRSEIAALKSSLDGVSRSSATQYNKLADRLDRAERAQTTVPKTDAAFPKEATGSIAATAPAPAAAVAPLPAAVPQMVTGWTVRDVYRGAALLQSRMGGMIAVETGDVLPGLGRVDAIRRQDGHWVVMTSKGMITSMR